MTPMEFLAAAAWLLLSVTAIWLFNRFFPAGDPDLLRSETTGAVAATSVEPSRSVARPARRARPRKPKPPRSTAAE